VVLSGEAGVGKRWLARQLHHALRPGTPLVSIHCGTLTRTDQQTGADVPRSTAGAFEVLQAHWAAAGNGAVLLEEVADIPSFAQPALMRILQAGNGPLVLATTHRDPSGILMAGMLRRDLAAELVGLVLDVPPLRERVEDVGVVVAGLARAPSLDAVRALLTHAWPQNFGLS